MTLKRALIAGIALYVLAFTVSIGLAVSAPGAGNSEVGPVAEEISVAEFKRNVCAGARGTEKLPENSTWSFEGPTINCGNGLYVRNGDTGTG